MENIGKQVAEVCSSLYTVQSMLPQVTLGAVPLPKNKMSGSISPFPGVHMHVGSRLQNVQVQCAKKLNAACPNSISNVVTRDEPKSAIPVSTCSLAACCFILA
jgi:hypothetical protein